MAKRKPYRFLVYLVARSAALILSIFPRPWLLGLARAGAKLLFFIVPRHREATLDHLRQAYGTEKPEKEIRQIAVKVFENLAQTGADVLIAEKLSRRKRWQKIIDLGDAPKAYKEILAEGHGMLSVTAHIGNWELLAGAMVQAGASGVVMGRKLRYEPYNQWVIRKRLAWDVRTIYRDTSPKEMVKLLRRNQIIGVLPDQDIDRVKGIFISFFGRQAYTPVGPVKLSLMSGAPILTNFVIRQPDGNYRMIVGDVIRPVVETTKEAAIVKYTAAWMESFEKMIRMYPEQWAWMHNRWKTRPEDLERLRERRKLEKLEVS